MAGRLSGPAHALRETAYERLLDGLRPFGADPDPVRDS
jgi:hypothetical protein